MNIPASAIEPTMVAVAALVPKYNSTGANIIENPLFLF